MKYNVLQLFPKNGKKNVSPLLWGVFMLLAVLFPVTVHSQNTTVYNVPTVKVRDNDVIREWTKGKSVAFLPSVDGGAGAFALIDKAGLTVTLASVPSGARAYDFRVVDDSVFFCGSILLGMQDYLLVGSFDINDVFTLGGSILYGVMSMPCTTQYGLSQVLKAWRMDTYRLGGKGRTHIVAVGASYMNGGQYDRTTMLDAYFDGTNWVMTYHEDKDGDEYFTDITCTDNYVVASAMHSHPDSNGCFIRVFHKTSPFVSYPVYTNQLIRVHRGLPTGKVLIESLGADSIAIAYYESLNTSAGSTIQLFDLSSVPAMPTLLQSIYIQQASTPAVSSAWRLRDIKYSPSQRRLTLLQTQDHPVISTMVDAISEYELNNLPSLTCFVTWISNTSLFAIDKRGAGGYESIGYNSTNLMTVYDNQFQTASSCNETDTPNYIDDTQLVSLSLMYTHEGKCSPAFPPGVYTPVISTQSLKMECKD